MSYNHTDSLVASTRSSNIQQLKLIQGKIKEQQNIQSKALEQQQLLINPIQKNCKGRKNKTLQIVRSNRIKLSWVVSWFVNLRRARRRAQVTIDERQFQKMFASLYDPQKIPGDFQQADWHGQAMAVGIDYKHDEIPVDEQIIICACCARQVQKIQIDLNCNNRDFSFLGSGFTLFFEYIKQCCLQLFFLFGVSGLYNLLTDMEFGTNCKDETELKAQIKLSSLADSQNKQESACHKNWITVMSIGNKLDNQELMFIQEILNFTSILVIIILLQIMRKKNRIVNQQCDEIDVSPQDYAILVHNIPLCFDAVNDDYDDDLKDFLADNCKDNAGQPVEIIEINLCYNLTDLDIITEKIQNTIIKKKDVMCYYNSKKTYPKDTCIEKIDQELNALKEEKCKIQKKFGEGKGKEFVSKFFTGKAFIQFNQQQQISDFLEKYKPLSLFDKLTTKKKQNDLIYHGNKLKFQPAPAPSDVFWTNLHITESEQDKRRVIGQTVLVILLFLSIYVSYALAVYQRNLIATYGKESSLVQIVAIFLSSFITVCNALFNMFLIALGQYFKFERRTQFNIEVAKGQSVVQFLNSAIIPFGISYYLGQSDFKSQIFSSGGLANNQYFTFITMAIVQPLTRLLDPDSLSVFLIQKWNLLNKENVMHTQQELNELWEFPEIQVSDLYAMCLNTVFLSAFYSIIIPSCILWGIFALTLQYFIIKYLFLRKRSVKFYLGKELGDEMVEQLEYVLPIYSLSNLFFLYIFNDELSVLPLIGLFIGIVHAALPMGEYNEILCKIAEAQSNTQTLLEVRDKFLTSFSSENPATAEIERMRKMNLKREELKLKYLSQNPDEEIVQNSNENLMKKKISKKKIQQQQIEKQEQHLQFRRTHCQIFNTNEEEKIQQYVPKFRDLTQNMEQNHSQFLQKQYEKAHKKQDNIQLSNIKEFCIPSKILNNKFEISEDISSKIRNNQSQFFEDFNKKNLSPKLSKGSKLIKNNFEFCDDDQKVKIIQQRGSSEQKKDGPQNLYDLLKGFRQNKLKQYDSKKTVDSSNTNLSSQLQHKFPTQNTKHQKLVRIQSGKSGVSLKKLNQSNQNQSNFDVNFSVMDEDKSEEECSKI